mgnify:CR=1 FL=1
MVGSHAFVLDVILSLPILVYCFFTSFSAHKDVSWEQVLRWVLELSWINRTSIDTVFEDSSGKSFPFT